MKSKSLQFIKKRWFLLWVSAVLIGFFTLVVKAEYLNENSYMKRVVVSTTDLGMMFSSNYLVEGGSNAYQVKQEQENNAGIYTVNVYLWNYNLSNSTQCYQGQINYTVSAKITTNNGTPIQGIGGKKITIIDADTNQVKATFTGDSLIELSFTDFIEDGNGAAKQKQYIIKFEGPTVDNEYQKWDLDQNSNLCVQMIAKPNTTTNKDLKSLGAIIGLRKVAQPVSSVWTAELSETQGEAGIDGYNLVLSGSGKAKIVLKWDAAQIDLNKYFRTTDVIYQFGTNEKTAVTDVTDKEGWKTVTINADANTLRNRYNIQLYLKAGVRPASGFFAEESEAGASALFTYSITTVN